MSESLAVLQEQYFTLMDNLPALLKAARDDQQRRDIKTQYQQAQLNFLEAQNRVLDANDPKVQQATKDARAHQKSMKAALERLEDVAKVLDIITGAVSAGTHLASMFTVPLKT